MRKKVNSILNEEEKKILSNIINAIKPFTNIEPLITKEYKFSPLAVLVVSYDKHIILPAFDKDKMFVNLEYGKPYTLEELGL